MCLSLVVITGYVGQISIVQLALAGVSGFILSHLATDHGVGFPWAMLIGAVGATVCGLVVAVSRAARPRRQPRRRHARRRRRDRAVRLPEHDLGRRQLELAGAGAEDLRPRSRPVRIVPRPRREGAEPGVRLLRARRHARARLAGREPAPLGPRAADARRPLERARRGGRRDQRPQRQARGVRNRLLHRRNRRRAVRLQLQLGHGQPLLGADRAQPDRAGLRRRHHDGLGRGVRRPHLGRGAVPVRAREVVRDLGQLGPAVRRAPP